MALTLRQTIATGATNKGSELTYSELDANFVHLLESSNHNFTQSGIAAVAGTVEGAIQRLGKRATDYMTAAQIADVLAYTGAVDVSTAFQAAADAAETAGDGALYMPRGRYNIGTTGIVVSASTTLIAEPGAEILYTGTGTALTIEGSQDKSRVHFLPDILKGTDTEPVWNSGTDTTSIGLKVVDCHYDHFHNTAPRRFNYGIQLENSAANTVCNTFYLGRVLNNRIGIRFDPENSSFGTNQNTFIGGVVRIDSAYTTTTGRKYIEMLEAEANGNTFVGVNLEASAATQQIIDCSSVENVWINCRFEGAGTGAIVFNAGGNSNKIIGGLGDQTITGGRWDSRVADAGDGNLYMWGAVISGDAWALNTKDVSGAMKFGNQTTAPSVPIGAFGTNRLWVGTDANTAGIRYWGACHQEESILTTGTTPTMNSNTQIFNYASPATLTAFGGVGSGTDVTMPIILFDLNGNITLTHQASPTAGQFKMVNSGANLAMAANTPYMAVCVNGAMYVLG
jgi:hypothetical protein